jgi:hypothetical protein
MLASLASNDGKTKRFDDDGCGESWGDSSKGNHSPLV